MDPGEVLVLVTVNAIIDSVLGLVIGLWLVARKAGQWARRDWTAWLESPEADPYLDRVAERVITQLPAFPKVPTVQEIVAQIQVPKTEDFLDAIEPRLAAFEEQLSKPVEIDLAPIVGMVVEQVIPRVKDEVATIRSVIEGKIGWIRKVGKQTGEAIAEVAGEQALEEAGIDPGEADMMGSFENMLNDSEWVKAHPGAAFGLRLLKGRLSNDSGGRMTLQRRKRTGRGLLGR